VNQLSAQKSIIYRAGTRGFGYLIFLGTAIWGPICWLGMNTLFFLFHYKHFDRSQDIFIRLLISLAACEILGLLVGIGMWIQFKWIVTPK
jgi:hypothetical protein